MNNTFKYDLLVQLRGLQEHCPRGIYVRPVYDDGYGDNNGCWNVWLGVMFVHSGPFAGGVYRFRILFSDIAVDSSPESQFPQIWLTSDMFHPLIDNTGSAKGKFTIPKLLVSDFPVIQSLYSLSYFFSEAGIEYLKSGAVEVCPNPDALSMLCGDVRAFNKIASNCAQISQSDSVNSSSSADRAINFSSITDRRLAEFKSRIHSGTATSTFTRLPSNGGILNSIVMGDIVNDVRSSLSSLFPSLSST